MRRETGYGRPAAALFIFLLMALFATAQAPPIVGSAPVLIRPSVATPQTESTFSVDVVVDLTGSVGSGPSGSAPVALSAFRIPIAFDKARLELTAVAAGTDPLFAPVGIDATPPAAANANGTVIVTATLAGGTAPSGLVSVVTLTFRANAAGPAGIAADAAATSLASAIQGTAATLFGPTAIAARPTGGGVVVQTPAALRATVIAGPAPINTNGRLLYSIRVENNGGADATGVTLSATIPGNTTYLAAGGGGTHANGVIQWTAGAIAGAAAFETSFAVTVNGAVGTSVAPLTVTASATNAANAIATSDAVSIVERAVIKPGSIVTMTSYGGDSGVIYDITTGTAKTFGRILSNGWAGALLFTNDGTLYATSNAYGGAVFDATAGGDLRTAAPIARGLGIRVTGIAADANGNLYISSEEDNTRIQKIARDGTVTQLPPVIRYPGGLLVVGNLLYVSEGLTGIVKKIDLTTNAISNHVTGFPPGQHFFSGQMVRTPANRLFILWGQSHVNRGLFEISFPGTVNMNTPLTAAGAFRIDINQLAADAGGAIYFGGNGSGRVYRAPTNGSFFHPAAVFADNISECESLSIYPRPAGTLLVLTAAASLTETYAGRDIVYTLNFENAGGTSAVSTLTFQIPTGTTFVSASNSGASNGTTVTWNLNTVTGGATGTRTVTVRTTAAGGNTLASTATVSGNNSTATVNLPLIAVLAPPQLNIVVEPSTATVAQQAHLLYTIRYSNTGGAASADTRIRNVIPGGSLLSRMYDGGNQDVSTSFVDWNIGSVAAGASGTVSFAVRATGTVGGTIANNGCTISAAGLTTVTAAPVTTSITASSTLTAALLVGPSPVVPGSQVNVRIRVENKSGVAATNAVITVGVPDEIEILSTTDGGTISNGVMTWTLPSVPVHATNSRTVRYSFRTKAQPGFRTVLRATIRSDQHPLFTSVPGQLEVRALPTTYVPGTVLSGETYINAQMNETHLVRMVGSTGFIGTYATPPFTNWLGALHVAKNRHLYAVTKWPSDSEGAMFDLTAGGDLRNAAPFAEGLGGDLVDITSDDVGNIYAVRRLPEVIQQVRKITPEGDVTIIGPNIDAADGIYWRGGLIYYSEGHTGRVMKFDPNTWHAVNNPATVHASGFPISRDHFSGHFVEDQQGRFYVLWGIRFGANLGLFDITQPGLVWSSATPAVTAKNAFVTDLNQMGLGIDNSIWFSGNGSRGIWRAPYVNGAYGPAVRVGNFDAGDNEALAIVPPLDLTIAAAAGPVPALSGDVLTWTLSYANVSGFALSNAYVESPLPSGSAFVAADGGTFANGTIRWNIGTLPAGGTGSVSFTARITAAEGTTVVLQNYVVHGDGVIGAYGAPKSVTVERPLAIAATASPSPVTLGQNVIFFLRYENLNATAASDAVIRAALPAGATYVSGGSFSNGEITFNTGTVAAGAAGEVSFILRADALPSVVLDDYAIVSTPFGTRSGVALAVPVLPLPVALRVSASAPSEVTSGELLTYTLDYANDGGSTAPATVLSSGIPEGTEFDSSSGGGTLNNARVVWSLGALASGDAGSVTFTVRVTADGGATITNDGVTLVSGTQTQLADAVTTSVVAPPPPPALGVVLSADPSPVTAGRLLVYSIVVTNSDDEPAEGVLVTTSVPAGTSFVSSSGADADGDTLQWSLGALASQASETLTFTVRVDADAGDTVISDGATAFSTGRDAGSSGSVTTPVIHPPSALRLTITAPESVLFGGNITYTLAYANDGPSAAAGARLVDPLPSGTTFVSASNGGSLANGIVTWNLGTVGAGASGTRTLVVATTQGPGSTVSNSGSTFSTDGSPSADGGVALTGIVAQALQVSGTLTTNKAEYFSPEAVEQRASFSYASGGANLLDGLTGTLVTTNSSDGVVATHAEAFGALTPGETASLGFDWSTADAASGAYKVTFTVTDATRAVLFTRDASFTVHARDGAGLTGTIAAPNSPVPLGGLLRANFTVSNASPLDYDPLALSILVTDDASGEPVATIPLSVSLAAGGSFASHASIPTLDLALGEHGLWLVTTDGGGRLLATTTFVVAAPALTLEPSAITISAGTSGSLVAALTAPTGAPVTLSLTSSNPAIASVPASITIPADASNVTIPVQGVAISGPVTITAAMPAALGGASASSSVLVVASGAITATLQVYQGENVSFAVTINNQGNTALTNAAFTIDIVDPGSGNVLDTIPLVVTVAAGGTYQTTAQHDTSGLAFQKYIARLVFLGVTPSQLIAQAEFEVLEPPLLRLQAAAASLARVLIWSSCSPGNSGQPCTPVPPAFLTQTLTAARIPYVVVGEENAFLAQLRTGGFSAVILDEMNPAEPRIAPELLESIHAGTGLLFIHSSPNAMPKLAPALGVRFNGKQQGPTSLQFLVTPFTSASTLTLNGDGTRITLEGAQAVANLSGSNTAAIAYHQYGRGRTVVIPFDLEQTQGVPTAALIVSSVNYVSRVAGPQYAAGEVVPIRITVTTPPGGQLPVAITIALSNGVTVVDASPALTSTNPLQWSGNIGGNTTATFDLWVRLPDVLGTATVTVTASLPGGPPIVTEEVELEVTLDAAALQTAARTELQTLRAAATRNTDIRAIDDALAALAQLGADAGQNVTRVVQVLDELAKVSLDTGAARAAAGRVLVYWQGKV